MEVYVHPTSDNRGGSPFISRITRVGRLYFYVRRGSFEIRFDIIRKSEASVEGYISQYKCYKSEADYNAERNIQRKTEEIIRNAYKIKQLTPEQIETIYGYMFSKE